MTNPQAGGTWAIDTRDFVERRGVIEAEVGEGALPRFAQDALAPLASVKVRVEGVRSPRGKPGLRLRAECSIQLECQRCMRPVTLGLSPSAAFELVDGEDQLDAEDDGEWDALVHSAHLDLLAILEDELLLALPYAPMHADCSPTQTGDRITRVSPFAALAPLKGARASRRMN